MPEMQGLTMAEFLEGQQIIGSAKACLSVNRGIGLRACDFVAYRKNTMSPLPGQQCTYVQCRMLDNA